MFHVKHGLWLSSFFIFFGIQSSVAQGRYTVPDAPFVHTAPGDSLQLAALKRNPAFLALSGKEQEYFRWVNLFRKDPGAFRDKYILPFLSQFPNLDGPEAKSLLEDLKQTRPLEAFLPDPVLNKTTRAHAMDLSQRPHTLDHNSRNGTSFRARMEMAGKRTCAGENLFDGQDDPLFALIVLLIDHGVAGAGHRKALMKPEFTRMGVAIQPWKGDAASIVLVQDFSCD